MLLAHAAAVEKFNQKHRARSPGGRISIALSADWTEPITDSPADAAAAARRQAFQLGWFADPIWRGHYPATMVERVGARLPTFTPEQTAALKGSSDFFGLNWYSARLCAGMRVARAVLALPSLLRMAASEPEALPEP